MTSSPLAERPTKPIFLRRRAGSRVLLSCLMAEISSRPWLHSLEQQPSCWKTNCFHRRGLFFNFNKDSHFLHVRQPALSEAKLKYEKIFSINSKGSVLIGAVSATHILLPAESENFKEQSRLDSNEYVGNCH